MTSRAAYLAEKRHALLLRCALQRQQVAFLNVEIENRLAPAERVFTAVSTVVSSPLVLIGVSAAALLLGPWRIARWVSNAALMFNIVRYARRLFG